VGIETKKEKGTNERGKESKALEVEVSESDRWGYGKMIIRVHLVYIGRRRGK